MIHRAMKMTRIFSSKFYADLNVIYLFCKIKKHKNDNFLRKKIDCENTWEILNV